MKELQFLIYNTPQENVKIDVVVKDETIWLTQKTMAMLFDTSRENITMHLKSIFESSELQEDSVCKKFLLTAADGKNYNTQFYSLDTFTMQQFAQSVNEFLNFRKFQILIGKGKISKEKAEKKAAEEYDEFNKTQKFVSDFDKEIKRLKESDV